MEYKIREANIDDLLKIQELNQKLCQLEFENFDDTIYSNYPFSGRGEKYFTDRILDKENSFSLVATDLEENIIAYFIGGINEVEDYRAPATNGEGETMYVAEEFRGKGIGTNFMKMFEDWAKLKGVKRLRLVASSLNERALNVYKKEGYKIMDVVLEKEI